jgi:preprotein translocase subunit SecG
MTFLYYFAVFMFIIVAALLCGVILIQENKSMGLGASFGGDAGSSVFGTSTALIVKKITAWLAIIFFATCIILSLWTQSLGGFQQPNLYPTQADDELVQ